jgi:SNF2 family DNA or RNA helicase
MAYFRSPSFVARYLPLDDPLVRGALSKRETRRKVIARGMDALRHAILEEKDASNQTYMGRVGQFLDFASELAERAERRLVLKEQESSDESENPLQEYLDAVSIYSKPRRLERADEDDIEEETDDGSYRVMPLVRMVYGKTETEIRDRLMLAFNSPLFPEILVSSSVMGEGVDLHRFCRHVIHHDLCWNPSTLEQRTGRLDRVRCKAELCLRPIEVYEPFLAGSADEKMFRVLRDRERWFQIVMGQKFEFDEATSEAIASRIPLPKELGENLKFNLARWPVL